MHTHSNIRSHQCLSTSLHRAICFMNGAMYRKGSRPCWDRPSNLNVSLKSENTGWTGFGMSLSLSYLTAKRWEGQRKDVYLWLLLTISPSSCHKVTGGVLHLKWTVAILLPWNSPMSFLYSTPFSSAGGKNCWHKCEGGNEIKRPYFRAAVAPLWLLLWEIKS